MKICTEGRPAVVWTVNDAFLQPLIDPCNRFWNVTISQKKQYLGTHLKTTTFLSTPGRFQGTSFHCYLCPKKIKSCQSPNIHFLSFLQMKILPRRIQKKGTLLLLTSFLFKIWWAQKMMILTISFLNWEKHSFLSSFSFCVVDSWLSFSHDRRSPSTEVSLSLTVFVRRDQDFEREESCSKFKRATKRLLEHLYLKTLFWHHE